MDEVALSFTCSKQVQASLRRREELRAFLDYVVLVASGCAVDGAARRSALFFIADGASGLRLLRFGRLERQRAMAYLAGLCSDLLRGTGAPGAGLALHPYLLPHEAVFASQSGGRIADAIRDLYDDESTRSKRATALGPMSSVIERYAPPSEEEARRMVEDRFGLFFQLAVEEQA